MKFKKFLNESIIKHIPWNSHPKIGWWLDNDPITFYHGTHKDNAQNIIGSGLYAPSTGPTANWVSLALEPNTAFGYASMAGGETTFRSVGKKAKHIPPADRVVFIIKLPKDKVLKNMGARRGNIEEYKKRLEDKDLYDAWKKTDSEYYQLTEIRYPYKIDISYLYGWMKK